MPTESENNKRIAKNTVYLYIRMFITMLVGLYTSRVVLNTLGVSDYGIYNVMGGVIGMLAYVNSLLSGGTSRFLTMDIGKGDKNSLKLTFAMANTLGLAAAIIVLILGETLGLWFMKTQLNIDCSRMDAALWVYQCALASCCLTALQTPFTASIIAHEKMDIYAYMSIFDVVMKLCIVFMLTWFDFDKLKLYAVLMFSISLLNLLIYAAICIKKFEECKLSYAYNGDKFKEMMTYSGWNMVGAFANVLNNYGLNILLNIFFGTLVNAARGIAMQVNHVVAQFYSSFQTASRPQIMKYYAQGDVPGMSKLICNSSKYCSYLLLCIVIPLCFNIDGLLQLWLGQNPEYTSWFIRVMCIQVIFQCIDYPVGMGIHAVGRMKLPNITSAIMYLMVFPLSWVAFKLGSGPITGYCVYLAFAPLIMCVDLFILRRYAGFHIRNFISTVIIPIGIIALSGSIPSYFVNRILGSQSVWSILASSAISFVIVSSIIFFFGLPLSVRKKLVRKACFVFQKR